MLTAISKYIFYPLWELKDRATRLRTLRELERSQWLAAEKIRKLQWEKLKAMVAYSYASCPYYRQLLDTQGISSSIDTVEMFRRIPILTKKDIREHGERLLSIYYRKEELIEVRTGGSTGKALRVYVDLRCQETRNAAAMRSDRWAGWDMGSMTAAIWGNPPVHRTIKSILRNLLLDRVVYLDTMNLNAESMSAFVAILRRKQPRVIYGHSHSIFMFACFLRDNGISDIRPKGIISTSMMLLEPERDVIETTFNCKVTNRYGCEEVGLIGCECEQHRGMHINDDHVFVEIIKADGTPAKTGEEGAVVVTDLTNFGMPMIRYRVEDVGVAAERLCPCGRGLTLIERVTGRVADFLKRRDGSMVAGVSLVERTLTAIAGIEQMQVVQETLNDLIVYLVRDGNFSVESERQLRAEFTAVFGEAVCLTIHYVDNIPQEKSSKYRFAICRI